VREWLTAIGLFVGAALLGAASFLYPSDLLFQLFLTVLAVAFVYLVFEVFLVHALVRQIRDDMARYSLAKMLYVLSLIILGVILIEIWVADTQGFIVSLGIIMAAVAIDLQDLFRNFAGSIILFTTRIYQVGDRISTGAVTGDVVDIGLMNTTVMEAGGWIRGDQPTGRFTTFPNGVILKDVIHNFTPAGSSFLWDEITIPLTYGSDWKKARDLILPLVVQETAPAMTAARQEIGRMGEKYYLAGISLEPGVYIVPADRWIEVSFRYVTGVRERRETKSRLTELMLAAISAEPSLSLAGEPAAGTSGPRMPP
jgi:small-conductance mechanosensitive channel